MNAAFPATYFDGETLRPHAVTVQASDGGHLRATGEGIDLEIPTAGLHASDQLGRVPCFLRLPGGGCLEIPCDEAGLPALEAIRPAGAMASLVHRLESHSVIAAMATLLMALTVATMFWQGLPYLARRAAYEVPVAIETQAGRAGYVAFARAFQATTLDSDEQHHVRSAMERLQKARTLHVAPSIVFLHMQTPNAFALPGGIIVVTDELVRMAQNDDELAAVLAHEIGHVELRHGLQSVLRNSSALIVVSTVTGDLSTLSTFSGTLPFLLLQYGYNREFEREADAYAVSLLRDAHIDPVNLATMLQRLEKNRPSSGADFSYLSTHPATDERVKFVRSFRLPPPAKTPPVQALAKESSNSTAAENVTPVASVRVENSVAAQTLEADALEHLASMRHGNDPQALSRLDQAPYVINRELPVYPFAMRKAGITGEVTVDLIVDSAGRVQTASVVQATRVEFEKPSLDAVKQWVFEPGKKGGHPVKTHMRVPIRFRLNDPP